MDDSIKKHRNKKRGNACRRKLRTISWAAAFPLQLNRLLKYCKNVEFSTQTNADNKHTECN